MKKRIDFVVGAKDQASKKLNTIRSSIGNLKNAAVGLAGVWAGSQILQGASRLAQLAAESEKVNLAFDNMARSVGANTQQLVGEIEAAAGGTISQMELVKQASKAVTLGIPVDKIAGMMEIARASSVAMGESVEYMFQSIVTGTARQSKLILDNLGIIINQEQAYANESAKLGRELTETEKRQIFLNEVLRQGQDIIDNVGGAVENTATKQERAKAATQNFKVAMGQLVNEVVVGTGALDAFSESLTYMTKLMNDQATQYNFVQTIKEANWWMYAFGFATGDAVMQANALLGDLDEIKIRMGAIANLPMPPPELIEEAFLPPLNEVHELITKIGEKTKTTIDFTKDYGLLAVKQVQLVNKSVTEEQSASQRALQQVAKASFDAFVGGMVESMWEGKSNLRDIFNAMAKDFIKYFIKAALAALINSFIPGLGSILGGIFDTYKNDMMAYTQGAHFAGWFIRGANETWANNLWGPQIGGALAGNLSDIGSMMMPAANRSASMAGGAININIYGDNYDEVVLLKKIERAAATGRSQLSLNRDYYSGEY